MKRCGRTMGEEACDLRLVLATADFSDGFGRDFDRLDKWLEPQPRRIRQNRLAHLVLEARIGVDHPNSD